MKRTDKIIQVGCLAKNQGRLGMNQETNTEFILLMGFVQPLML